MEHQGPYSLHNLQTGPISYNDTLHWDERLVRRKHSCLMGPFKFVKKVNFCEYSTRGHIHFITYKWAQLHWNWKACQGQTLLLTGPIQIYEEKWSVLNTDQVGQVGHVGAQGVRNGTEDVVAKIEFCQILQGEKWHWDGFQNVAVCQNFVNSKLPGKKLRII